jgi:hypothetical protein
MVRALNIWSSETTAMGDLAGQIGAMEAARFEENKRLNAEREIAQAVAPDRFEEMKAAFRKECVSISQRSHRFTFECADLTPWLFSISNVINGQAMRLITLRFDVAVPRIVFETHGHRPQSGSVGFLVRGSSVFFANGTSGVVLPEFVVDLLMHVMKHN